MLVSMTLANCGQDQSVLACMNLHESQRSNMGSAAVGALPMATPIQKNFKPVGMPSLACCLCFAVFWAGHLFAADWPQWRGPNRDAVWTESGIVEKLPNTGLRVLWRAPIAMGFSSPVIAGGKVYLSDAELKKPLIRERVHCLA